MTIGADKALSGLVNAQKKLIAEQPIFAQRMIKVQEAARQLAEELKIEKAQQDQTS